MKKLIVLSDTSGRKPAVAPDGLARREPWSSFRRRRCQMRERRRRTHARAANAAGAGR